MGKKVDFELILKSAVALPMVKINRCEFLQKELGKKFDQSIVSTAIAENPAKAGIDLKEINRIADACIDYETLKVSSLSFVAGLPGGITMAGTIPADLTQYFGHIVRILQKLAYLYGWDEFFDEDGIFDDETSTILTLFIGVMFGVNGAASTITKLSASAAKKASKSLAQKALTKGTIYPIVKKIAQLLGLKMTKEIFAKGAAKALPVIGGVVSGTLTFASYKSMAIKLKKYLAGLHWADPKHYADLTQNEIIETASDEVIYIEADKIDMREDVVEQRSKSRIEIVNEEEE